ncbi:MAG: hypothetical protein M1818_005092 [Claussenomyces sp. TS43310]|nr:MAG: hypothetical protein M1818_005092 [Claussenomyces sp. TS43310]
MKSAAFLFTALVFSVSSTRAQLYHEDLGTTAGTPTVSWAQGSSANITLVGGALHGGGSCQISLSYDKGKSFTVIQSIEGGCPLSSGENFNFTVPADAPTGTALLAWSWLNKIGYREFYMNCAAVTITAKTGNSLPKLALASRPGLFLANLNNGCETVEGSDAAYPDPGPDVIRSSSDPHSITGTCLAVNGSDGGAAASNVSLPTSSISGSSVASRSMSVALSSSAGAYTSAAAATVQSNGTLLNPASTSVAAAATDTSSAGLTTISDGQCSGCTPAMVRFMALAARRGDGVGRLTTIVLHQKVVKVLLDPVDLLSTQLRLHKLLLPVPLLTPLWRHPSHP